MAIVQEQEASAYTVFASSVSLASALTGIHTDEIVILVTLSGSGGYPSPPDHYETLIEWSGGGGGSDGCMGIYYRVQPDETEDPTVTFDGSEEHYLAVYVVSGLANPGDDIDPTDASNSNATSGSGTTVQPGTTGTLAQAAEWAVAGVLAWGDDETISWDSGFTEDFDIHNGSSLNAGSAHKITTATTALNPTITFGGSVDDRKAIIGTFKGRAAPSYPTNVVQMRAAKLPTSTDSDIAVTLPATPTEDNGLLVVYLGGGNWGAGASISGSGWTELMDSQGADPPYSTRAVYYKVAGSSEPSTITVTLPQSDAGIVYVVELEGIDDTDFLEDSDAVNDTTTGTSMTSGTVTVASGAVVLTFMHMWNTNGDQTLGVTAGWEKLFDVFSESGGGSSEMQSGAAVDHWDNESNTVTWSYTSASTYGGGTVVTVAFNTSGADLVKIQSESIGVTEDDDTWRVLIRPESETEGITEDDEAFQDKIRQGADEDVGITENDTYAIGITVIDSDSDVAVTEDDEWHRGKQRVESETVGVTENDERTRDRVVIETD